MVHPHYHISADFYPRSPRGERLVLWVKERYNITLFLSTLPARGATQRLRWTKRAAGISIHAPREGSDYPKRLQADGTSDFYPRSPRGERHFLIQFF